jgi:mediator of RNA polymerase II transcription subunit 5
VLQASPEYEIPLGSPAPFLSVLETVLDLLALWPANQTLIEYLAETLKSQTLPLHIFTPVFLRATRKPELGDPRSLDMLCRLTVDTGAELPLSVLIDTVNPIEPVALSLLDAYHLLRLALGSPYSPLHDLQRSAEDLLSLLLQHLLQYNQAMFTHLTPPEALQVSCAGAFTDDALD